LVRRLTRARALGALLRTATRPVPALALYAVALIGWHLPGPYGAALAHHRVHVVEHLALMATALIAWWPVLSPSGLLPRLHYGAQVLYLFAFGIPMTAVAAMITGAEHALYPFYAAAPRLFALTPLADQRLGGLIMWVPAGVIPLVAFTVVFFRWVAVQWRRRFTLVEHDVTDYIQVDGALDWVLHFASPASPRDYLELPIQTLKVGALGTHKALGVAKAKGARFLLASTSEVYGDPLVHPQREDYWGHVNPVGPRGVYDEAKRFGEAITMAYHRAHGIDTRIVRI